jgi:UDP-glucuronate 4-epimerase
MKVIVTGGAGFIGSHLCQLLASQGHTVVAIDNLDPFYDPALKRQNLACAMAQNPFRLVEADIRDLDTTTALVTDAVEGDSADVLVHLAARAGVRPSLADPMLYSRVNVDGTVAMLELARRLEIGRFVFGSSSSVYGDSARIPFVEHDGADRPISPYAATKRAGELLCHTYHHLFGLSVVCLRFFTVYGPRQRPDLAIHRFADLLSRGEPIPMFGDGTSERDYTYVDDITAGIEGAIEYLRRRDAVFEIVNLGGSRTTSLKRLISLVADAFATEPVLEFCPPQPGDVRRTFADVTKAETLFGYRPEVPIEEGIARFARWFRSRDSLPVGASPVILAAEGVL